MLTKFMLQSNEFCKYIQLNSEPRAPNHSGNNLVPRKSALPHPTLRSQNTLIEHSEYIILI